MKDGKGIGDLALDILKDMQEGYDPLVNESELPDISDSDRDRLIGHATGKETVITESVEPVVEEVSVEHPTDDREKFLEILESTMQGLEQLKEMTSVGMMGVNMAGPAKKEPKAKKKEKQPKKKKGSIDEFLRKVEGKC